MCSSTYHRSPLISTFITRRVDIWDDVRSYPVHFSFFLRDRALFFSQFYLLLFFFFFPPFIYNLYAYFFVCVYTVGEVKRRNKSNSWQREWRRKNVEIPTLFKPTSLFTSTKFKKKGAQSRGKNDLFESGNGTRYPGRCQQFHPFLMFVVRIQNLECQNSAGDVKRMETSRGHIQSPMALFLRRRVSSSCPLVTTCLNSKRNKRQKRKKKEDNIKTTRKKIERKKVEEQN